MLVNQLLQFRMHLRLLVEGWLWTGTSSPKPTRGSRSSAAAPGRDRVSLAASRPERAGRAPRRIVEQSVEQFRAHEKLAIVVAPEGTRRGAEHWKSGFYRIAHAAGVPIVLATANYEKKEIAFPAVFHPTGDMQGDIRQIQAHYAVVPPRHPERLSAPLKALRDEGK